MKASDTSLKSATGTSQRYIPTQDRQFQSRVALTTALVLPTLNAGSQFPKWLQGLKAQSYQPDTILLIDSSSNDNTVDIARSAGFETYTIRRSDFSHGGTRQMAVELLDSSDVILFMTQDAFLADKDSLANLIKVFTDSKVGAAYGRQLPREKANPIEAHARLFNYPSVSEVRDAGDIPKYGIKTSFISNSFAGWRRKALLEVGGFPRHTIQNEDAYAASKLIQAGWKIAYCADATVYHSHNYSIIQEFKRYFDIGVFHARDPWIRRMFGKAEGEGMRFVKSELHYLSTHQVELVPSALLRTGMKLIGYKLGTFENRLPVSIKRKLSMNKTYWKQD